MRAYLIGLINFSFFKFPFLSSIFVGGGGGGLRPQTRGGSLDKALY